VKKVLLLFLILAAGAIAFANWPTAALPNGATADRVVVDKSERSLTLYRRGTELKTYRVSLGAQPSGHKLREGDNRTPEGVYTIDRHKADSSFHRALHLSYPSPADRAHAARLGVSPGGDIMIHGLPNRAGWVGRLQRLHDWTAGCIAVTNPEVEEIYRAVPDGTAVEIRP
jgi:murein L,D-transpeptidase YafK